MKWSRFIFSMMALLAPVEMMAEGNVDSVYTATPKPSAYDKRVLRYRKHWEALIPTQIVVQNAGNMGIVSVGMGWNYGKCCQWETHLLLGYIPEHQSSRGKLTMTLKENYIPWSIDLKRGWSIEPLQASIYMNTVYGHEFWKTQPNRYPDSYYDFLSTKFRLNVALGQRVTWQVPCNEHKIAKSVSLFYEVGTCDLYIRSKFIDSSVPLKDILGLSLGVVVQML